jgi:hypothetical protein
MPSPIAHLSAGYLVYCACRGHHADNQLASIVSRRALLAATAGFSVLPDADVVVGVAARNMARYYAPVRLFHWLRWSQGWRQDEE